MITAYEVGAVLRVIDDVSLPLQKMAAAAREFDALIIKAKESLSAFSGTRLAGLIDRLGVVNKSLVGVADTSTTSAQVVADNFLKVDAALGTSLDAARALKVEMGEIAAASKAVGPMQIANAAVGGGVSGGAPPGIRRRAAAGGSHPHMYASTSGLHGGWSLPSTPAMAAAATVGYGAYIDAEMEDAIFQIEYHTGQKDTPENNAKFRKIIQDAMSKTGSSLTSVTEAVKQEVRMFKGTPGGGVDVLPEMLMAAATEAKLKGTSLEESMSALIGLAHMTKEYSPEQIKKLAPAFAFLSASNPASLGGIERAASYAVPILQSGLEIDPIQTLLLGTALTRAGATNTKSGTWLRNMALASMPGTSLMSKIAFQKHEEALKALGLVDENNKPTWFDDKGKPDLIKMLDIAGSHAADIPLEKRAAYEKQLFGTQGFGGFALLADPAVKQQIAALGKDMNSPEFKNRYANFMQDYGATSPLQMGRQTWADLQNALMDLGKTVMPSVVLGLKGLDVVIKAVSLDIQMFGDMAKAAGSGLSGLGGAVSGALRSLGVTTPNNPGYSGPHSRGGVDTMNPHGDGPPDLPALGVAPKAFLAPAAGGGFRIPGDLGLVPPSSNKSSPPPLSGQGAAPVHIHNKTVTYLDGKVLGEAMSSQLAQLSTFPRQAAYGDSYVGWNAPDNNFATV